MTGGKTCGGPSLPARAGRFNGDGKILFYPFLTNELCKTLRTELRLEGGIVFDPRGGDQALAVRIQVEIISRSGH